MSKRRRPDPPDMIGHTFHCAGCGGLLPSTDAVCPRCERELSAPEAKTTAGKYRCPACLGRFDRPDTVWLPHDAPWYRPQIPAAQCPHCRQLLRNRGAVPRRASEYVVMAVVVFLSGFAPWRPGTQIVLLGLYGLVEFLRWRRARSDVFAEEDRFAIDAANASRENRRHGSSP